eukprot:scaffold460_cov312-Pinguiococcus_pyrenoidosus.AAC.1
MTEPPYQTRTYDRTPELSSATLPPYAPRPGSRPSMDGLLTDTGALPRMMRPPQRPRAGRLLSLTDEVNVIGWPSSPLAMI